MNVSVTEVRTAAQATVETDRSTSLVNAGTKKILVFDSWTAGTTNLERLVDPFAQRGIQLLLLHIGSWGHDRDRPKEERIGGLLVRDISYYGGLSFKEILETERPSAVLFLSVQALAHRAFNRYCAQLKIPTLHLYHGIVNVQSTTAKRMYRLSPRAQFALAASRLWKNLRRLWPAYLTALWKTRASIQEWLWFPYDVYRQISGRAYTARAAPDTLTTACCVYTEADVSHAADRYRMPVANVVPVGNPDLVRFGLDERSLGTCLAADWRPSKTVMYIDTALIEAGAVFDGAEDFAEHLRQTRDALARHGFKLIFKPHPAHLKTGVLRLLQASDIELCQGDDFISKLKHCRAAITESSSAALIPALLGVPLLLAAYGKLANQKYGPVLTSYPRGMVLSSIDNISTMISALNSIPVEGVRRWIDCNAGPLPASAMAHRVADVIAAITKADQ